MRVDGPAHTRRHPRKVTALLSQQADGGNLNVFALWLVDSRVRHLRVEHVDVDGLPHTCATSVRHGAGSFGHATAQLRGVSIDLSSDLGGHVPRHQR